jgi:hypothetical protein
MQTNPALAGGGYHGNPRATAWERNTTTYEQQHSVAFGNKEGEGHPGHALSTGEYGTHATPVWHWIYLDGIGIRTTLIKKIYVYE